MRMEGKKGFTLQEYIRYYTNRRLHKAYSVEDCVSEINLVLLMSTLAEWVYKNEIPPKGRELSFLKSIMCRQRQKHILYENRQVTGSFTVSVLDHLARDKFNSGEQNESRAN